MTYLATFDGMRTYRGSSDLVFSFNEARSNAAGGGEAFHAETMQDITAALDAAMAKILADAAP